MSTCYHCNQQTNSNPCEHCGTVTRCTECNAWLHGEFCRECGAKAPAPAAATTPSAPPPVELLTRYEAPEWADQQPLSRADDDFGSSFQWTIESLRRNALDLTIISVVVTLLSALAFGVLIFLNSIIAETPLSLAFAAARSVSLVLGLAIVTWTLVAYMRAWGQTV